MPTTLEEMQMVAFQIIAQVGEAKSLYIEAIKYAKQKDFQKAQEFMKDGDESYSKAHHFHHDLVQKEAAGEQLPFSLLLIHAEDQLLSTETIKIMAEEIIVLHEKLQNV